MKTTSLLVQETDYAEVTSRISGNTLYRNDSSDKYLLSPIYRISQIRMICNREIVRWSLEDSWRRIVGTKYEVASKALLDIRTKQQFIEGITGLLVAINDIQNSAEKEILVRTGLRRRFVELTSELWEAGQLAAPFIQPFTQRTSLDFGRIAASKRLNWLVEISEASNSQNEQMQRRASFCAWKLAMTCAGVKEIGDITPETVRTDAITNDKGLAVTAIRPILAVQKKHYGEKAIYTEHDWGVGRGKPTGFFEYESILKADPNLTHWREFFIEWLGNSVSGGVATKRDAISVFFRYLLTCPSASRNPIEFASRSYVQSVGFEEWLDQQDLDKETVSKRIAQIASFFNWLIDSKLSLEDDLGRPVRNPALYNPITRRKEAPKAAETAREAIPIRYLRELVHIITHDDFSWPKKVSEDYIKRFNSDTQLWERIWNPIRAYAMLLKLYLPLRTYQITMLDSGEGDTYVYYKNQWQENLSELKPNSRYLVKKGFLRKYRDHGTNSEFTGFYVNTNKTADRFKDLSDKGYEIPWQHDEVITLVADLVKWQSEYNPIFRPTPWTELTNLSVLRSHTSAQLKARGTNCFLFRDYVRSSKAHPIGLGRIQQYWHKLLDELERRVATRGERLPDGRPIKFIEKRKDNGQPAVPVFDLHSLRVSILTALSVEGGVPLSILSKCVAGHATILMTLYYIKQGPAYISQKLAEAQAKMMESEQENYLRFLQNSEIENFKSIIASNDLVGIRSAQEKRVSGWMISDLGICPVGGALCGQGGPKLTGGNGRNDYQPTPGGPRNCIRCRFFLSGPAFLAGLVASFNSIGLDLIDASEQMRKMDDEISKFEDRIFKSNNSTVSFNRRLDTLYARRETALGNLDMLANNWHSTYIMIERAKSLISNKEFQAKPMGKEVRLLATGDVSDLATAIGEGSSFDLYNSLCQHATVYPASNIPVAAIRRGRLLDAMLSRNDRKPIFSALTDQEAISVGNELVNFLYMRIGRQETHRLIEGTRLLKAVGIHKELDELLSARTDQGVTLPTLAEFDDRLSTGGNSGGQHEN
nr:VPA1269 family protein [uncultured Janthinobacterium sp.]